MSAVPREDRVSHLEGFTTAVWQATTCEREGKAAEGGHDLACRRITFVALDGAVNILGADYNIAEAIQLLFPMEETVWQLFPP